MKHPSFKKWDKKLKNLMNDLDEFLEEKYRGEFRLHPVRQRRGKTSNKAQDGLFSIVASFSLGTGSKLGRGYVVDVHLATLEDIPDEKKIEIESAALNKLKERLPTYFSNRKIFVDKDGNIIKIHGDLSLGEV